MLLSDLKIKYGISLKIRWRKSTFLHSDTVEKWKTLLCLDERVNFSILRIRG